MAAVWWLASRCEVMVDSGARSEAACRRSWVGWGRMKWLCQREGGGQIEASKKERAGRRAQAKRGTDAAFGVKTGACLGTALPATTSYSHSDAGATGSEEAGLPLGVGGGRREEPWPAAAAAAAKSRRFLALAERGVPAGGGGLMALAAGCLVVVLAGVDLEGVCWLLLVGGAIFQARATASERARGRPLTGAKFWPGGGGGGRKGRAVQADAFEQGGVGRCRSTGERGRPRAQPGEGERDATSGGEERREAAGRARSLRRRRRAHVSPARLLRECSSTRWPAAAAASARSSSSPPCQVSLASSRFRPPRVLTPPPACPPLPACRRRRRRPAGHSDRAWQVTWSPTERLLASCSTDKTVRLWSYAGRGKDARFLSQGSISTGPSDRPSARSVIGPAPTERGELTPLGARLPPSGHSRTVRSLAFSPSGSSLALASFDSTVSIWERTPSSPSAAGADEGEGAEGEWECVSTLEGHDSECKAVAWSASGGLLASCSRDKSVWVWEGASDSPKPPCPSQRSARRVD